MKHLVSSLSVALLGLSIMVVPAVAGNFEQEQLVRINSYRAANNLKPFSDSKALDKLAREHSRDMQKTGKLSHNGFKERFQKAKAEECVENVGWNHQTPVSLFEGWKNSSGHDKNMLNPDISKAGLNKTGPYVTFFACK